MQSDFGPAFALSLAQGVPWGSPSSSRCSKSAHSMYAREWLLR